MLQRHLFICLISFPSSCILLDASIVPLCGKCYGSCVACLGWICTINADATIIDANGPAAMVIREEQHIASSCVGGEMKVGMLANVVAGKAMEYANCQLWNDVDRSSKQIVLRNGPWLQSLVSMDFYQLPIGRSKLSEREKNSRSLVKMFKASLLNYSLVVVAKASSCLAFPNEWRWSKSQWDSSRSAMLSCKTSWILPVPVLLCWELLLSRTNSPLV